MVLHFLRGAAAIHVLSKHAGAKITVVDMGVAYNFQSIEGIHHRKIAWGSKKMLSSPAMSCQEAEQAIQTGIDIVLEKIDQGLELVTTGEIGIGNTTLCSAITAMLTGSKVKDLTWH